jgi:hypothetical protein
VTDIVERSITVHIDIPKCADCVSKACIAACKTYSRGILQLDNGSPSIKHIGPEEALRRGTECLACEYACWKKGNGAINIEIPIKGLDEYIRGIPLSGGQ